MACKWKFTSKFDLGDTNFARIYSFYVITTPVKGVSARGITFDELGINMRSLNSALKKATPALKGNWYDVKVKDVEQTCKDKGIFDKTDPSREIAIHSINSKHCTGKTDSLFYAIRCALAHGSFNIQDYQSKPVYILENRDDGKLKARIILKESTLLSWIDVVKSQPKPSNKKGKTKKR